MVNQNIVNIDQLISAFGLSSARINSIILIVLFLDGNTRELFSAFTVSDIVLLQFEFTIDTRIILIYLLERNYEGIC